MRIVVGGAESRTGAKRKIVWLTRTRYRVEFGQIRAARHKAVDVWRLRVASYFVVVVVFLKDDDDMLVSGNTGHNCISPNRTTGISSLHSGSGSTGDAPNSHLFLSQTMRLELVTKRPIWLGIYLLSGFLEVWRRNRCCPFRNRNSSNFGHRYGSVTVLSHEPWRGSV
jgi:hypothetical protein